ncbi:hypothetical protein [Paenibacillus sp. PAMC21692]|uniref:hypothetical protein n=1 Tax=Paenibacillus sp. PAMC21692 TaxID=2762320 RepID=UPI00164E5F67|nr:hypothetical protein [Paenibacillus sp. PAMC21692]QNK54357.1 hypothetical protein H7F31_16860 [Paenibacillus sp. PAMC21692]
MPETKREELYFGLMMCTGMVVFMTFYNLATHGLLGSVSALEIIVQLAAAFVVAILLEMFVVGPLAHKALRVLPINKSKKAAVMISLACMMVTGMVLLMSLFGWLMSHGADLAASPPFLPGYFQLVLRNFVFALPLQLLVVGPLVRYLFGTIKRKSS